MARFIPGFRFHPTDVELVIYYLKRKLLGKSLIFDAIAEVNIYDFTPWDLPDKSKLRNGDLEWFFFCPKEKKYSCGSRTNRATESGYWKATGKDRPVEYKGKTVAMIKTLVFHLGHAPKGERTDWVMHEYRMEDKNLADAGVVQDSYVICRLFKKSGAGPKNGAQYGAPFNEDEWDDDSGPSESSAALGLPLASEVVGFPLAAADSNACTADVAMATPQTTSSVSVSDPGPSTITTGSVITASPDEPVNDNDTVFTDLEIAALLGDTDNHEEVQVNAGRDEESEIFDQLEDLIRFEDRNDFNMSSANCTLDMFVSGDDLETDLGFFY